MSTSPPIDLSAIPENQRAAVLAVLHQRDALRETNRTLEHLIAELNQVAYGKRSERLSDDERPLAFEDLEAAMAEAETRQDAEAAPLAPSRRTARRNRGHLPAGLPCFERVIEPDSLLCPCGCGEMHRIGEDRTDRLDIVPAQLRVIVTIRPKYACRRCAEGVTQAPAPAHLIEGGLPTEGALAHVLVSKCADHLPLYRQSQILARAGVELHRSTLADWVGTAAVHLDPVVDRLAEQDVDQALYGRNNCTCARSRPGADEDRLSLGLGARRSNLGRSRPARRGVHLRPRPRGRECRAYPAGF